MSNRREVLQMGIAATLLPLGASARAVPSTDNGWGTPLLLSRAIYDTRFDASRAFGQRMTASGVATAAMSGDVTALWFDTLYPQWQEGLTAPIAGLTARGPLFCLEQLAWDHGMRVVFRAQHAGSSAGAVRHEFEGAGAVLESVRRAAAEDDWVSVVSDVIVRYPLKPATAAHLQVQTARPVLRVPEDELLYSWVIAPVVRG